MIDAEGSRLLADVFNTLTEEQKNIMPEDVAERIERFMTANGFRMVFGRWFLQCEPEVKQDPVAKVDANDECYWADILPDRSVKVGQLLYAFPPDAQAEIERRDARIKELEERLNEAVGGFKRDLVKQLQDCRRSKERQAAEINEQARLLGISAEKELTLRAENGRLKAELAEWKATAEAHKENYDNINGNLRMQLAVALESIERKDHILVSIAERWNRDENEEAMKDACWYALNAAYDALAIKPDATALKARDEALIERCAEVCEGLKMWPTEKVVADDCAVAIRELKGKL